MQPAEGWQRGYPPLYASTLFWDNSPPHAAFTFRRGRGYHAEAAPLLCEPLWRFCGQMPQNADDRNCSFAYVPIARSGIRHFDRFKGLSARCALACITCSTLLWAHRGGYPGGGSLLLNVPSITLLTILNHSACPKRRKSNRRGSLPEITPLRFKNGINTEGKEKEVMLLPKTVIPFGSNFISPILKRVGRSALCVIHLYSSTPRHDEE